jgi:hypothetical protein
VWGFLDTVKKIKIKKKQTNKMQKTQKTNVKAQQINYCGVLGKRNTRKTKGL